MLATVVSAAAAAAFVAASGLPTGALPHDVVSAPPQPAQEVSLASLGLPAQTVHGSTASVSVGFPAPAANLSSSGSYARVFFGHSRTASPGSNLQLLVNGEAVDTVPLTDSTAAGSVFVVRVAIPALHVDRPNVVEFRFSLLSSAPEAADHLFGRVDAQTALHYELAAAVGRIDSYPYSLLAGSLAGSMAGAALGLVLPNAPDDRELATAFRLVADASRLLRPAELKLRVVTAGQQRWLESAGSPALMVGRFDDLPSTSSAPILEAAGFARGRDGHWFRTATPTGMAIDDGVIAASLSPWDHGSPVILVTGATDLAVAKAGDALLHSSDLGVTGQSAVVSRIAVPRATDVRTLTLGALLPDDLSIQGRGEHRITFSVPAPAIDNSLPTLLRLRLAVAPSRPPVAAGAMLAVEVDGRPAAARSIAQDFLPSGATDLELTGDFRAGMNGVALTVSLADGFTQVRLDTVHSQFDLPPEPNSFVGLEQLPYPFLGDPQVANPGLVLANLDSATLDGAASAAAALGSRAIVQPAELTVAVLGKDGVPVAADSLIVIGGPADQPLQLRSGALDAAAIFPPAGVIGAGAGWIEEVELQGGGWALWVGGDPAMLARSGWALGSPDLHGQVALVGPDGIPRDQPASPSVSASESFAVTLIRLIPVLAVGLLLAMLALQLRRSRRWAA